jgi:hypothetical protein
MKQAIMSQSCGNGLAARLNMYGINFPRRIVVGAILVVALMAFELFNFDTTRYALSNLIGQVSFLGLGWATILAVAFCAIDFAGLVRMFTPENSGEEPREVWFLMGAWLLGATMNALMTWWAVSLTLLSHDFGNEVLSRGQLLQIVPVFVAVLVWLTRILFIGALTVAGEHLIEFGIQEKRDRQMVRARTMADRPALGQRQMRPTLELGRPITEGSSFPRVSDAVPQFLQERNTLDSRPNIHLVTDEEDDDTLRVAQYEESQNRGEEAVSSSRNSTASTTTTHARPNGRVRQRPPLPGNSSTKSISARPRGRN